MIPLDLMWKGINQIIKPNTPIVIFGSQPFTSKLILSNEKNFKYCWIWDKKHPKGFLNAKHRPLTKHEDICVFSNKKAIYNPVMRTGKFRNKKCGGTNNGCYGEFKPTDNYNDQYYPTSIIEISSANQHNKDHPTQKPLELMEYLVKTYTNQGDLVLDFCAGSFTTGLACKNLDRSFIGIEKELEYVEIGKQRLN